MALETTVLHRSDDMCSICSIEFKDNDKPMENYGIDQTFISHCNQHEFHYDCILNWIEFCLAKPIVATCPICRMEIETINKIDIHKMAASERMKRQRLRTTMIGLRHFFRKNDIHITIKSMIENSLARISYMATSKYGPVLISCIPDSTKRFGDFGYEVSIQLQ